MRVKLLATGIAAAFAIPAWAVTTAPVPLTDLSGVLNMLLRPEYAIWGTALVGLLITGSALRRRRHRMPQATD
jgi:hypothetical protein